LNFTPIELNGINLMAFCPASWKCVKFDFGSEWTADKKVSFSMNGIKRAAEASVVKSHAKTTRQIIERDTRK